MKLTDIFKNAPARDVTHLAFDSREAKPNTLFFALQGAKGNGADFAAKAIENGAVAIVSEQDLTLSVPCFKVENARLALSQAAALFYPRQPETIVAVTGTSGKTSVASFMRQIFNQTGGKAASIGTIGIVRPNGATYGGLTTPDPLSLHHTLDTLAREGATHVAFEASSHGLDQYRLDGVRLKAAAFTNLSRDHLDYHLTLEDYLKAKLRLFHTLLPQDGTAVIMESEFSSQVKAACGNRNIITIGGPGSVLGLKELTQTPNGQKLILEVYGRRYFVEIPLLGRFQVENILTALGLGMATGLTVEEMLPVIAYIDGAKGRLEEVGRKHGAPVIVDYAHKPDALEKALQALRPFVKNRLIVVFGCGGDRDKGKRPLMGEIAARLADVVFVTDDNPRSEEPATIRAEILAACKGAQEIGDRKTAIETAIAFMQEGDVLLIAGKGHETGQIIQGITHDFSDELIAKAALK
jgi:UDP-N-acetylmuramyl-tripeptide synthetase